MKYRLVQVVKEADGRRVWPVSDFSEEQVYPAMEVRGFKFEGLQEQYKGGIQLREQLVGAPRFSGVAGPMWGGEENGEPIIRYESWDAYNILST